MTRRTLSLLVVAAVAAGSLALGAPSARAEGVRYRDEVFSEIATTKDVVYGEAVDHTGATQVLTLDVHQPAGDTATKRAAVVWVHGGYFKRGTKQDYQGVWQQFARAGYVTVSIDYRLNPTIPESVADVVAQGRIDEYIDTVRDAQHDAQAAIRWVRAHAAELRVDPELVAVVGHSAGGLTANMVAFNDEDPGTSGNPGFSSRPAAAVAMAGGSLPIKMTDIDPGEPPFLVVHGLLDTVVPYVAAPPSCLATIALLNVCEQVLDPDQDHGTFGLPEIRDFLYRWLIARPGTQVPTRLTVVGTESLLAPQ
jgi:dienelactone hydrolase